MKLKEIILALLMMQFICSLIAQSPAAGAIPFNEGFDTGISTWETSINGTWINDATGKYLQVENMQATTNKFLTLNFDFTPLRGMKIALSSDIKAENIISSVPWKGIKVMLVIKLASEPMPSYQQIDVTQGSFGWRKSGKVIDIPSNATTAQLVVGIQEAEGKVWFDNIKIVVKSTALPPARPMSIPIEKYHTESVLRGVMVSPAHSELSDVSDLKTWNANVVRWQFGDYNSALSLLDNNSSTFIDAQIAKLSAVLPHYEAKGIRVILDLHLNDASKNALRTALGQQNFINLWDTLAQTYKNKTIVWAYDIANEPWEDSPTTNWQDNVLLWNDLVEVVAKKIRISDVTKPILISSIWGNADHFKVLKPIDFSIPNILYTTHFYEPILFTHQGLPGNTQTTSVYPDTVAVKKWDKAALKAALNPVKAFQDTYRVPILIGEFSAVRWAPNNSASTYMKDCIDLFEEYNWDWIYHAFRESGAWDVELTTNKADTTTRYNVTASNSTDRAKLLGHYFLKNNVPINDEPCSATPLTATSLSCSYKVYSNVGATSSSIVATLPSSTCPILNATGDVWFKLTMPTTKKATVNIKGLTLKNLGFAFYQADSTCSKLVLRGSAPCQNDAISWNFFDNPGTVYYIRVWGANGERGTFNLCSVKNYQITTEALVSQKEEATLYNQLENTASERPDFVAFPNPICATALTVSYNSNLSIEQTIQLKLFDLAGKIHVEQVETALKGNNRYNLSTSNLPIGIYVLQLHCANQEVLVKRVQVE